MPQPDPLPQTDEEKRLEYFLAPNQLGLLKKIVAGLEYRSDVSPEERRSFEKDLEEAEKTLHVRGQELGIIVVH
ncbi:MAG: hypothetical protein Q8P49_02070 [Candidatus Liptonbacteria bacterium]|nr:hypothetical protein [Candidatus Liptonbacteria bacterium]